MEDVINAIRAAVAPDATPDAKSAGIAACRAVLAALDATPGQSIGAAPIPATPVAAIVGALRGMPPDQLLDLAIAKLRAALPADAQVAPVKVVNIPIVPVPRG
jgi:hypothetical protein